MSSKHGRLAGFATFLCAFAASMSASADRQANDQNFVSQVMQAGMGEVELSRLAMTKSTNPDIRAFAERMVADHSRADDELAALVQGHDIDVPSTLDADHREIVDQVSAHSGTDFDTAYAKQMAADHAGAVMFFRNAAAANDLSPALANFASRAVPTIEEHAKAAKDLESRTERGY